MEQEILAVEDPKASGAQAVMRAMSVLHVVALGRNDGISLVEMCKFTGLNKSTAHRIAAALVSAGMVDQDPESRRYFLGVECYALGLVAAGRFGLQHVVEQPVSQLARKSGDAGFFSLRQGDHSLCLIRRDGSFPLKTHVLQTGDRHPLGVGGGSLAMLAALAEDEREQVLERVMDETRRLYPAYTLENLRAAVRETQQRGMALNRGLVLRGSWGYGMAVRDAEGVVMGAYSVATVESRATPEHERLIQQLLNECVESLEQYLRISAQNPVRLAGARALAPA